jgi:hypothetical protein
LQRVHEILLKSNDDRTFEDIETLHGYLVKEVKFFKTLFESHKKPFMRRVYEVLELKHYEHGAELCKFGEMGETFFIILNGEVGVLVPTSYERQFETYHELLSFLVENNHKIQKVKDNVSRELLKLISLIGETNANFKTSQELVRVIEELLKESPTVMAAYSVTMLLPEEKQLLEKLVAGVK